MYCTSCSSRLERTGLLPTRDRPRRADEIDRRSRSKGDRAPAARIAFPAPRGDQRSSEVSACACESTGVRQVA